MSRSGASPGAGTGGTLEVLVVDDSAVVRRFLSTVIAQHEGVTVETVIERLLETVERPSAR